MPLFFILSGFSLAIMYGSRPWAENKCCGKNSSPPPNPESLEEAQSTECQPPAFNSWRFYRNRFARTMPVYYICTLIAIPPTLFGFGSASVDNFPLSMLLTIIPVVTLVSPLASGGIFAIDGPSWTVCTLIAFWAFFPCLIPSVQRLTDKEIVRKISICYWAQFILIEVVFYVLAPFIGFWGSFSTASMNPITRFPLFLMGMYAGILVLRYPDNNQAMPWPSATLRFFPYSNIDGYRRCGICANTASSAEDWGNIANRQSITLLVLTLLVGVGDTVLKALTSRGESLMGAVWLQGTCVCVYMITGSKLEFLGNNG